MKNPHTLPRLRDLAHRANRTLTNPRVTKNMPDKFYNEMASIPGLALIFPAPSVELDKRERAAAVLAMVNNKLRDLEIAAAREFGGGMVIREHAKAQAPAEKVEQGDMLPETVSPSYVRKNRAMRAHLPKELQ